MSNKHLIFNLSKPRLLISHDPQNRLNPQLSPSQVMATLASCLFKLKPWSHLWLPLFCHIQNLVGYRFKKNFMSAHVWNPAVIFLFTPAWKPHPYRWPKGPPLMPVSSFTSPCSLWSRHTASCSFPNTPGILRAFTQAMSWPGTFLSLDVCMTNTPCHHCNGT